MSTYQGQRFLEETLKSVLDQTFRNFEFVIVDDGSIDETVEILYRFSRLDPRIRVVRHDENLGTGTRYTELIHLARGRYIAMIGQDDRWSLQYLEKQLACLQARPEATVSFATVEIVDADGKSIPNAPRYFQHDRLATLSHEDLSVALLGQNFLCAAACFFEKKSLADWMGLAQNDQLQDWDTWLHLTLKGPFIECRDAVCFYRVHGMNLSLDSHRHWIQIAIEQKQSLALAMSRPLFSEWVLQGKDPNHRFLEAMRAFFRLGG
jgi:glycosyltransferase involved in cell wall biosynthesis